MIPIFRKQIERGGPVTVTHPEMTRYFMTIPEAVSLVVQAGAIGGRGQVFVLDMGDPVKIVDLAQNMIRLSGKVPRLPDEEVTSPRDIPIRFIGSRPGEKIHEELWSGNEALGETAHPKIRRLSRAPVDPDWLALQLARARTARGRGRHARGRRQARRDGARAAARRAAAAFGYRQLQASRRASSRSSRSSSTKPQKGRHRDREVGEEQDGLTLQRSPHREALAAETRDEAWTVAAPSADRVELRRRPRRGQALQWCVNARPDPASSPLAAYGVIVTVTG